MDSKIANALESSAVKSSLVFKDMTSEARRPPREPASAFDEIVHASASKLVGKFKRIQETPLSTDNVWAEPFLKIDPLVAKSRSFDSTMGTYLEEIAHGIVAANYTNFGRRVEGWVSAKQMSTINRLCHKYYSGGHPKISDYADVITPVPQGDDTEPFSHTVDLYFQDGRRHYVFELKLGGNLDVKKAQGEKFALLQSYCALRNKYPRDKVFIFMGTLYSPSNRAQFNRVTKFFAPEEMKIGSEFWNFICGSPTGYDELLSSWQKVVELELS